jgi:hypothetical protein
MHRFTAAEKTLKTPHWKHFPRSKFPGKEVKRLENVLLFFPAKYAAGENKSVTA